MSLYVKQSSQRCQTRQHWTGCLDTVGERVCMLVTDSTLSTVIEKLGACCNKSKRPGYTSTLSAIIFCISLCFAGFPVLFIVVEQFQHYLIKFLGTIIDHPSETVACRSFKCTCELIYSSFEHFTLSCRHRVMSVRILKGLLLYI